MGDGRLGGISTTIAAAEALLLRGYDLAAVALMDDPGLANWKYLREHFGGRLPVMTLPPCTAPPAERQGMCLICSKAAASHLRQTFHCTGV